MSVNDLSANIQDGHTVLTGLFAVVFNVAAFLSANTIETVAANISDVADNLSRFQYCERLAVDDNAICRLPVSPTLC